MIDLLQEIAYIEPHDGHIASVAAEADQSVTIKFDWLSIYRRVGPDRYEIWHHAAVLRLEKATNVKLAWRPDAGAHFDDAVILETGTEVDDWRELLSKRIVVGSRITFSSGSTLEIDCAAACLTVDQFGKYVDDWVGAL